MKQANNMARLARMIPAGVYNGVIWFFSSSTVPVNLHNQDKTAHILEYTVLGFLLAFAFSVSKENFKKQALYCAAFGVLAGITDEIHQYFVPTRSADITDILADISGISLGILVWLLFTRLLSFLNSNYSFKISQQ